MAISQNFYHYIYLNSYPMVCQQKRLANFRLHERLFGVSEEKGGGEDFFARHPRGYLGGKNRDTTDNNSVHHAGAQRILTFFSKSDEETRDTLYIYLIRRKGLRFGLMTPSAERPFDIFPCPCSIRLLLGTVILLSEKRTDRLRPVEEMATNEAFLQLLSSDLELWSPCAKQHVKAADVLANKVVSWLPISKLHVHILSFLTNFLRCVGLFVFFSSMVWP